MILDEGWWCGSVAAGAVEDPKGLAGVAVDWMPAQVPGTVAGACRAAGRAVGAAELDGRDWWFRCRFDAAGGDGLLELGGVATVADVWLNGQHVAHGENMFRPLRQGVQVRPDGNELVVRCAALAPVLAQRRPRPRWKTYMVAHQNLRWVRTSLLGRVPGWAVVPPVVGLWRPVELTPLGSPTPRRPRMRASCDGPGGVVEAGFTLPASTEGSSVQLHCAGRTAPLQPLVDAHDVRWHGTLRLPSVARWWPHTHGPQPLYDVVAEVDGAVHRLGRVGFRTVGVDRTGGSFRLHVNGVPVFCRGACWLPPDPVGLQRGGALYDQRLGLVRAANMNMLRVPGTTLYEDRELLDRCDELGILVWQDAMFAFTDPPIDHHFEADAAAEVGEALRVLAGHPSVAVVCGNQEVEEIAAMNGLDGEHRATPFFDESVAGMVRSVLPTAVYVASNPTGGDPPFRMDQGVSQYFGVGGYLRPPDDARRSRVRFAAECLAFATPPEPDTVAEVCGGASRAGHDPEWKAGVHHDAGRSWDMEDVRDHYMAELFGVDPRQERYVDAERALELGRATNARLMEAVMTEWRRPGSTCSGALVLAMCDLRAGAGWGLVDVLGRPKAPWYALRRVLQPVALLAVDEGLNGLALHVVNDTADPFHGRLAVELVVHGDVSVERREVPVEVPARGSRTFDCEAVIGGWRDAAYAYRFSPPAHDAVVATLSADDGPVVAQVVHLPLGQARPLEHDLGLGAVARPRGDGTWALDVSTVRLAQWVTVRVPGFTADDSWFHLPPGGRRPVVLRPEGTGPVGAPRGSVGALNAVARAPITVVDR
ncbi:MAG TPA: hypothetical protein VHB02_12780 [Acidimicrobiales bacterium]|nr:hypothetical protein [Acidimicrobiales bacterium]